MRPSHKDLASGAVFAGVGLVYGAMAWTSLPVGRALAMGPGYFPLLISFLLVGVGLAIGLRALRAGPGAGIGALPWRGMLFIAAAVLFFALTLEQIGMFPAVFGATLFACAAMRGFRMLESLVAAFVIATLCTGLFGHLLRLPVPMFASPFAG